MRNKIKKIVNQYILNNKIARIVLIILFTITLTTSTHNFIYYIAASGLIMAAILVSYSLDEPFSLLNFFLIILLATSFFWVELSTLFNSIF